MLIALSPGENENAENRMFVGPSGDILDQLFRATGMERGGVYMTNLIKCMLPKCRRPKMDEINACSVYLYEEISIIQPEVMVPMGYYATRTIMTKYHADPPAARKDFKKKYGILLYSDGQKIFPPPHPATLLYDPSFEPETMEKYSKLKTLLHECRWYAVCPVKRFHEAGRLDRKWIELYCKGDWQNCARYHMEEKGQHHFDWMLPDGSLDENLKDINQEYGIL